MGLANRLSLCRILMVPLVLAGAAADSARLFLCALGVTMALDAADGWMARRQGQVSDLGSRLDSYGDHATIVASVIGVWILWPHSIEREAPLAIVALAAYSAALAFGAIKYGRIISYHTRGDKVSCVAMILSAAAFLGGYGLWPFRVAVAIMVVSEFEKCAISAVLPEWRPDVVSFVQALRIRRFEKPVARADADMILSHETE